MGSSGKRRRVKVGCQVLLKHNSLNMEKYFLLFLMLNIILESFVQGAPMSEISFPNSTSLDNEYSNLTVNPETPTPALCRDPEDSSSFLCSLYGLVGNVFSVGRAVGSVSKVAEKLFLVNPMLISGLMAIVFTMKLMLLNVILTQLLAKLQIVCKILFLKLER